MKLENVKDKIDNYFEKTSVEELQTKLSDYYVEHYKELIDSYFVEGSSDIEYGSELWKITNKDVKFSFDFHGGILFSLPNLDTIYEIYLYYHVWHFLIY